MLTLFPLIKHSVLSETVVEYAPLQAKHWHLLHSKYACYQKRQTTNTNYSCEHNRISQIPTRDG